MEGHYDTKHPLMVKPDSTLNQTPNYGIYIMALGAKWWVIMDPSLWYCQMLERAVHLFPDILLQVLSEKNIKIHIFSCYQQWLGTGF